MIQGSCECGAVRFQLKGTVHEDVTVCHCSQCRKTSGHLWAATRVPFEALTFFNNDTLRWYSSSDFAKRGFCSTCGSSLFYRMNGEDGIGIAAGCLDAPTGLHIGKHIFTKDKGDYYSILGDAPQIEEY